MKKLILSTLFLALSPALLTGCDDQKKEQPAATTQESAPTETETTASIPETAVTAQDLENKRFNLIEVNGKPIAADLGLFLQFGSDLSLSGKMCNNFMGKGTLVNDQLKSQLGMTMIFCGDESLNQLDKIIGEMFSLGAKVGDLDGHFVLTQGNNTLVYQFDKMVDSEQTTEAQTQMITENDLIHHQFELVSIDGVAFPAGLTSSLAFGENLHLSAQACNTLSGAATLTGDVIKAPALGMTRMFCEQAELNQLDSTLSKLFETGAKATLENNELTLSNGTTTLVYRLNDAKN